MYTYEVWYNDIEGTHYLTTVKARNREEAIAKAHSEHTNIALPQFDAWIIGD